MKKEILIFSIITFLLITCSAVAAVSPRDKECLQRGYNITYDIANPDQFYCVFPNGERCLLDEFNAGKCGTEYMIEDYCVKQDYPVWDDDRCCEGLSPYLHPGVTGVKRCQKVTTIDRIFDYGNYIVSSAWEFIISDLLSDFIIIVDITFLMIIGFVLIVLIKKKKSKKIISIVIFLCIIIAIILGNFTVKKVMFDINYKTSINQSQKDQIQINKSVVEFLCTPSKETGSASRAVYVFTGKGQSPVTKVSMNGKSYSTDQIYYVVHYFLGEKVMDISSRYYDEDGNFITFCGGLVRKENPFCNIILPAINSIKFSSLNSDLGDLCAK